ncbi:efflux RND transporter permease subunit [Arenicella xantha]|uniref:Multidrug efflux pump subunit AcrB n=1 Tax=Arenicella xantha TaxID=644221 RepID=A0A395JLI9_9GAMM|nr:efflux RND transporter permease subunit [Arenicella xantha]RBP50717.1 multidrug efflux pump subunit AcrB [Arenicella xantha]
MKITRFFINNPAITAATICLLILIGIVSVQKLPVQLLPSIERPVIAVQVSWRAASPREIESEVVEPIERELRGINGMTELRSFSNTANAWINMEFALGTDMDQVFTEVSSRIQRVRGLPADADRPQIYRNGGGGSGDTLIYLFVQHAPDSLISSNDLSEFVEKTIAPEFENIEGVSRVDVNRNVGEQIVSVEFDPFLTAQLGISIESIASVLNRSSDVSGGKIEVGRRDFTLRFEGRYAADQLSETILAWRNGAAVKLGDIAQVIVGPDDSQGVVYQNGHPALGMQLIRQPGGNTLAAIDQVLERMNLLNQTLPNQYGVTLEKSFDPSVFIRRAVSLLSENMGIGIVLAVGSLWLFVRRVRATLLIAAAIPISLMATFVMLNLFGRSINVISLAGLAFATGMVLDAAIVVLENYVRQVDAGMAPTKAALSSVRSVGGALLASTLTTIVIFVPIVFFEDVEGQLFADLALTIAIAVGFSFLVALLILPAGAAYFLRAEDSPSVEGDQRWHGLVNRLMLLTDTSRKRTSWIAGLTVIPMLLGWVLWPQLNYLPPVKRDAVDAFISFPSGASADLVKKEFAEIVVERLAPYMSGEKQPKLKNYYLFTGPWGGNIGIRVEDQSRVDEMVQIANDEILSGFPDTQSFAQQGSLFGRFGGGANISINLQSVDFPALNASAVEVSDLIQENLPGSRVRMNPDPQVVTPELRLIPDDRRLAEVGMTRESLSRTLRAFGDGLWLGEFFHQESRLDILLRTKDWAVPEQLETMPVVTPSGAVIPFGDLARIERGVGPNQIYRLDARRTIALNIAAPPDLALGETMAILTSLEEQIRRITPSDANISYGGDADSLSRAILNLRGNFALAVVLLFLVMAALFKSPKDALLVMISLPMAAVGGIVAVRLLNLFTPTPLDLLGMIGFIILLGLVVNNAILLVSETRRAQRDLMNKDDAVREALQTRMRPILMSTLTSLMGMLPLVIAPGAGSIIYKGLATVIVGGMAVSTLFTLILLPCLLRLEPLPELNLLQRFRGLKWIKAQ